ncbi:hypothetical protein [Paenibacillus macerans]|uniref:hypothetical protein n=1 Tax=Paenibacillus macerans TaxID=44252 RepID=UPI00203BDBDF|nr:hypothetical protein [Paenibacillus macerans]MCM3701051.1 hypothetical protein [Paenibacillus macerans]
MTKPVAFIIFNRPDKTAIVFEKIRKYSPKQLFVIADGPRPHKEHDVQLCEETRAVIQVDWDCDVKYFYAEENLGCQRRISSGLDEVFKHVEDAIILEDDCVPSEDFFEFCEELLDRYKHNDKITGISGSNFQQKNHYYKPEFSYYFSLFFHCTGWATWRRAWQLRDMRMLDWPSYRQSDNFEKICYDPFFRKYWTNIFDQTYEGKIDSWAYPFLFTSWSRNAYGIIPSVNLISDIGFDESATYTTVYNDLEANLPTYPINFPLEHPDVIERNRMYDFFTCEMIYKINALKQQAITDQNKLKTVNKLILKNDYENYIFFQRTIYIFGYGEYGILLKKILEIKEIKISSFLTSYNPSPNILVEGTPVKSIDDLVLNTPSTILISIEGGHDVSIINELKNKFKGYDLEIISWKDL